MDERELEMSAPIVGTSRDLDHFVFSAAKGKAIRFEVKARRFGTSLLSSLDSVLDVLNPKGAVLANNDDAFGKDAALVFTPPADGDYFLRIRDLNSKGSATAIYYIEEQARSIDHRNAKQNAANCLLHRDGTFLPVPDSPRVVDAHLNGTAIR